MYCIYTKVWTSFVLYKGPFMLNMIKPTYSRYSLYYVYQKEKRAFHSYAQQHQHVKACNIDSTKRITCSNFWNIMYLCATRFCE